MICPEREQARGSAGRGEGTEDRGEATKQGRDYVTGRGEQNKVRTEMKKDLSPRMGKEDRQV